MEILTIGPNGISATYLAPPSCFFFVFFLDMTTVVTFGNTGETRLLTNN